MKNELEKRKIRVYIPLMPESWSPKYEKWKEILDKLLIDSNSVLIGHSAGCAFLTRWLGETKKKVKN
jgi:predicted alpha/beta hydrolase family esterase